ncbi:hypothetical protein H4P12_03300 [Paracoccus sp. 11-3]|uniref:Uncharacterized protein n=1 Tax=Paracoccus amoyensis TaxID=2760093 RepID=A0A926G4V4_9RHOB|nr:hypothetical protein [Paracoccus amoyensis]MBC9245758.1 hypothetical protein [Paracoccus amoyensis]
MRKPGLAPLFETHASSYGLGRGFFKGVAMTAVLTPVLIACFLSIGIVVTGEIRAAFGGFALITLYGLILSAILLVILAIPIFMTWGITYRLSRALGLRVLNAARLSVMTIAAVIAALFPIATAVWRGSALITGSFPPSMLFMIWIALCSIGLVMAQLYFHGDEAA